MSARFGALTLLMIAVGTSGVAAHGPQVAAATGVATAAAAVVPAPAVVDLSGSWVGMIAIPEKDKRIPGQLLAVLKHTNGALAGTAGPNTAKQVSLTKTRVEATRFGTTLVFNLPGPNFEMEFQLREAGGMLKGVARIPGVAATAPVELFRIDSNARAKENLSGRWVGTFSIENSERLMQVVLTQSGAVVSGTAGPHSAKQMPIVAGHVARTDGGTSVSLQVETEIEGAVMLLELALTDTGLKGTVTFSQNGEKVSGPVELTPVK